MLGTYVLAYEVPHLALLDLFPWGYVKDQVYSTEPLDLADLKRRIVSACASMRRLSVALNSAASSVKKRIVLCIAAEEIHVEHFI